MKKFLVTIFIMIFSICGLAVSGCSEDIGVNQVNEMYREIVETYGNESGYLSVDVDTSKTMQEGILEEDKSYIFPLVYEPMFSCASGFFFGIGVKNEKMMTFVLEKFNKEELKNVYNSMLYMKARLEEYSANKKIFEESDGNLRYNELVLCGNDLLSAIFELENVFSKAYMARYAVDFSQVIELNNGILRDTISYRYYQLAKIAYDYEMKNTTSFYNKVDLQLWFDNTEILGSFIKKYNKINTYLSSNIDLSTKFDSQIIRENVISKFKAMQKDENNFISQYNLFMRVSKDVDLQSYFLATDKHNYVNSCDKSTQSKFKIINDYINNVYYAYYSAISNITDYLH